ncbi:MAG TPA: hypothetical protein VN114_05620 [Oxalicibacterium sp.]|uniref:hypothetical protein n=1 Tax=Oxalicibacterium sp. TaxID=2766525 RepID=UPI002C0825E9|nr:hypothetical protein [Oxalicibacterium sp.]HWU97971.1 hypothetical protein [Oxalicibacterium sp.]
MACDHRKVLDLAKEGNWEEAHALVQMHGDELSCQIHGYLHRVEGDLGNARYWYGRGNSTLPNNTLEEEYARLCGRL